VSHPEEAPIEVLVLGASPEQPPPGLPLDDPVISLTIADDAVALRDALPRAEVLFHWTSRTAALREAWPLARRLRWVQVAGVGVDWALFPELVESDIPVATCRGVFDVTLPEYLLALMLALAKDIPGTLERQAARRWQHRPTEPLHGRRVLIVGAGTLGRASARLLAGLGMEVTLVARRARPASGGLPAVHPVGDLDDLLPAADWLVLLAPLTEGTRGLIGPRQLALLPRGARLVNLGRGPLVQEAPLIEALRSGHLAAAALDVFDEEPLPPAHPFWSTPSIIVSPHIGGDVAGWEAWFSEAFVANLARYRAGRPLVNVIDKHLGYVVEAIEGGGT
jgi:phosphoglycerate dehydrogenase-like enzyme